MRLLFASAVLLSLAAFARADDSGPVKLSVAPGGVAAKAGSTVSVSIAVHIDDGYHIYSTSPQAGSGPTATTVSLKKGDGVEFTGEVKNSPANKHFDPNFGGEVETIEGDGWIEVTLKTDASIKPGAHPVVLAINYQACNDQSCLPPQEATVGFDLVVPKASQH